MLQMQLAAISCLHLLGRNDSAWTSSSDAEEPMTCQHSTIAQHLLAWLRMDRPSYTLAQHQDCERLTFSAEGGVQIEFVNLRPVLRPAFSYNVSEVLESGCGSNFSKVERTSVNDSFHETLGNGRSALTTQYSTLRNCLSRRTHRRLDPAVVS